MNYAELTLNSESFHFRFRNSNQPFLITSCCKCGERERERERARERETNRETETEGYTRRVQMRERKRETEREQGRDNPEFKKIK